jgi:RNA polymerase sigma-70 factor (ECF subfamily)
MGDSPSDPSAAVPDDGTADHRGTIPHLHSVGPDAYPNWDAIYLDNVERLYRMMYARVGNRADAEDLTAQVFQAALKPLRTSASVGEVRSYLLATARTVLASHWRRHYGAEITTIDVALDRAALDEPPTESDAPNRVRQLLAELPDHYARILQLRFLDSCTLREAAHAMNITVGNAKVLQHRALRRAAQVAGESR